MNSVPYAHGVTECRCTYPTRRSKSSLFRRRVWVSSPLANTRPEPPDTCMVSSIFSFGGVGFGFEPLAPFGATVLICNQEKTVNKRFFARLTTQCGDNARHTASKECPKRVYRATQHDYATVADLHLRKTHSLGRSFLNQIEIQNPSAEGIPGLHSTFSPHRPLGSVFFVFCFFSFTITARVTT